MATSNPTKRNGVNIHPKSKPTKENGVIQQIFFYHQ